MALACAGCRWLPMVRPQSDIDPRSLSQSQGNASSPAPSFGLTTGSAHDAPLPALPQMEAVGDDVALAQKSSVEASKTHGAETVPAAQLEQTELRAPPDAEVVRTAAIPNFETPPLSSPMMEDEHATQTSAIKKVDPDEAWRLGLDRLLDLARHEAVQEAKAGTAGVWWAREQVLDRLMRSDGTRWQLLMKAMSDAIEKTNETQPTAEQEPSTSKPVEVPKASPPSTATEVESTEKPSG